MQILDDILDLAKTISKMGSGNNIVGTEALFANTSAQALRNSIHAREVVRSFNSLGGVAKADIPLAANGSNAARKIAKGSTVKANTLDDVEKLINGNNVNFNTKNKTIDEQLKRVREGINNRDELTASNEALAQFLGREKPGLGYSNVVKGYFGDEVYGKARRQTAIVGAAGIGIGGRYLSGGNLTTNAQGERNIAGIPFI